MRASGRFGKPTKLLVDSPMIGRPMPALRVFDPFPVGARVLVVACGVTMVIASPRLLREQPPADEGLSHRLGALASVPLDVGDTLSLASFDLAIDVLESLFMLLAALFALGNARADDPALVTVPVFFPFR